MTVSDTVKTSIDKLLTNFNDQINIFNNLPVGSTGYLDLTDKDHFSSSGCDNSNYGYIFCGYDVFDRKYIALKLNVKEFQQDQQIDEYNCIYTIFERYSEDRNFICIANSHKMYDTNSKFLHNILCMSGLKIYKNHGWQRIKKMFKSFANKKEWKVKGFSSSNTFLGDKMSYYVVNIFN